MLRRNHKSKNSSKKKKIS
uniref:Uncharacterized protein n=1 Tax=Rhizophora mucronata TaxID=61149 RepID=A0A2P2KJK1_RHIMU